MSSLLTTAGPVRLAVSVAFILATVASVAPAAADKALLPDEALLKVHVAPLGTLYESSLLQKVWTHFQDSRTIQDALQTVEAQNLTDALTFLEAQLGKAAPEVYTALTAHGLDAAIGVEGSPWLLIIAHASDDQITADVVQLAVNLAGADVPSGEHRGFTGYQLGDVMIAAVGPRLIIGSSTDLLKATVDRILDGSQEPPDRVGDTSFHISASLDLVRLRNLPDVANGLAIPVADGGQIAVLGGWIDMLRREKSVEVQFQLHHDGIDSVVRFSGADEPSSTPFAGFWADADDEQPAPLLMLPGTIYSTTWYRDYGALWQARAELVTQDVVQELERADAEAAAQFETLGSAASLSDVAQQLGPRLRIVIAEQTAPPYDVELRNQLPAAALVVELKDEAAFRKIADPLARVLHLILSFEQKITSEPIEYAGTTLSQLSFPHTADDVRQRDVSTYNFRPTHAVTRGHFILGSTPEIVRQTIDALDEQSSEPVQPLESGVTSRQFVDIEQLRIALGRVRDGIVRQSVLTAGLDVEAAHHELNVLLSILQLFDTTTLTGRFTDDEFEYSIRAKVRDE